MSEDAAAQVPYYLMPIAALCGTYAVGGGIKAIYQVYKVYTHDANAKKNPTATATAIPPSPLTSKQFLTLISTVIASALAYGFICATVNNSIGLSADVLFDPFEILSIDAAAELAVIKTAYRTLSKIHHPDKGGDTAIFQKINLAYKALSDADSRHNWETYGHPDGPQTQTLSFALPHWLLHPEGNVAIVLLMMYLGMFFAIVVYMVKFVTKTEEDITKAQFDNSVAQSDLAYLATHLRPDSSHVDVLYFIATAPESIQITEANMAKAEEIKQARMQFLNPKKKEQVKKQDDNFEMDVGGWAEDEDEDEASKAARANKEEKEKLAKQVAAASGKDQLAKNIKIEGVDDGVLGQAWVERTLEKLGQWPPTFQEGSAAGLKNMTFAEKGSKYAVAASEHKAIKRNLCMTLGRLNARVLNYHDELITAGKAQLIDPTYFRGTMEYRQRTGLLLEAALRVAGSTRSYRLYKTIVECVAMFKIGTTSATDEKTLAWFNDIMQKTYGGPEGVPSVKIGVINIETDGEDEIATEDTVKLEIEMNRPHAENFTKQKIAMAMKQGVPAQIALQTYREGWWILIRCQKLDGDANLNNDHFQKNPLLAALDNGSKQNFLAETEENRLLNAWPFIVSNVAQKTGKVKVTFSAPTTPGKYKFMVDIKSQEFLGCDQVFTIEKEIIDKALVERKEEEVEDESEPKKTK